MPQYRFFFVREDGMPARGTAFPLASDERAIEFARLAANGAPSELCSGNRLVWRYPPYETGRPGGLNAALVLIARQASGWRGGVPDWLTSECRREASIAAAKHWMRMENDPKLNPGGDNETIEVTDASGGQKTGHIRWVLVIGTALAVVGVVVVWLMSQP